MDFIVDLDSAQSGYIQVSQQALLDVLDAIATPAP
jgi:hypothetical protein